MDEWMIEWMNEWIKLIINNTTIVLASILHDLSYFDHSYAAMEKRMLANIPQ